jgi:hypothetical protein
MRKLVLLAVVASLALMAACSEDADVPAGTDGARADAADDALIDPIVSSDGLGSCAERFSEETLADRAFAFDGTVEAISDPPAMDAPYLVEFRVARWFAGGPGDTVTLRTYDVSGTSLVGEVGLAVGDRILASGEDDFLWGCGFSSSYSQEMARTFERAFA